MDYVELGKRLRKRRLELRISQVELAEKLQLSKSFLSHVEHGNGKISLDKLVEISNILEVSLSYLLNDTSKNA